MSTARIVAIVNVVSDLPQGLLDRSLEGLKRPMADVCKNIEKNDLLVERLDIFRLSGTRVRIEAFPAKEFLGRYTHVIKEAHVCPECESVYLRAGEHPENGCGLGSVEDVLSL